MNGQSESIMANYKTKSAIEHSAAVIFTVCGFTAVLAVVVITVYMIISGTPALSKVGIKEILFGRVWTPNSEVPSFGILYIILTSILGTISAICIGVPIGVMTAVFLSEIAGKKTTAVVKPAIELLAGIPSVVYGLLGIIMINPIMYQLEQFFFQDSTTHQFTGGANLLSAILVLAIMILPTVINISESALKAVPQQYRASSLALGATKIQTIFKVVLPAAKSGILTASVLGTGRAIGEAMAIVLVSGNSVNMPSLFHSVRFLTTGIVSEMSYASGLHREVLFTIGLVLFIFIMIINILLTTLLKKGAKQNE